jgi:hypothetical protein
MSDDDEGFAYVKLLQRSEVRRFYTAESGGGGTMF